MSVRICLPTAGLIYSQETKENDRPASIRTSYVRPPVVAFRAEIIVQDLQLSKLL